MSVQPFVVDEGIWDRKEHDWTGKWFYFVEFFSLFGKILKVNDKLETLNRGVRMERYKTVSPIIWVQYGKMKGRMLIEIEKPDRYDAQVFSYEIPTTADSIVHLGGIATLSKGVERLKEIVYSRRQMEPREIYYLYQSAISGNKIVIVGIT
ncbi:MAG: hypothetical protein ACK4OO_06685 [bacterium]